MFHKSILVSIYLVLLSICNAEDASTCRSGQFSCSNNKCIPLTWKCDAENDCGDFSDEIDCNATACLSDQFTCKNGKCIPTRWRCDKEADCSDRSDEENCGFPVCSSDEFTCRNDKCIPATSKCDAEDDCGDNSDEENCAASISANHTCASHEFSCDNGKCIFPLWQCDGEDDCGDNSDEENCAAIIKGDCDKKTEFDCGNKTCIPIGLVCNKENDCAQSADELRAKCFVNECLLNNGGCPQLCVDDIFGFHCDCHDGYQLNGNGSCIDIDECQVPGICSQLCKNTQGGFNCSCVEGYIVDPSNDTRCNSEMGHGALLYKNGTDLLMLDIETREKTTVVSGLANLAGLDYDFGNDLVLWTDLLNTSMYRLRLENGTSGLISVNESNVETVLKDKLSEGLAIDWIYGNVYWTDRGEKSISVATVDGKLTRVLFKNNISNPRAIVVNPLEGWLFWTDWGSPAKIERAGMDGTHRSVIISEHILWPNGLAIDYETRRLFWTDGKLSFLCSSDYDGSNDKVILSSHSQVRRAFAIDVFEDWLYWSEWVSKSIRRVNKFTGKNLETVAGEIHRSAGGFKVYHPYKQPRGINYCVVANNGCSHFCLPSPQVTVDSDKFTCFCPAGMILAGDKRMCTTVE